MMHESFWDYSCRVYGHAPVSDCCLNLQNHHGLDVNLLLFAVWHARHHGQFDSDTLESALRFSASWAESVVRPLRKARTYLKAQVLEMSAGTTGQSEAMQGLRERIKALELHAEKLQQERLESLCQNSTQTLDQQTQREVAAANLQAILTPRMTPNPSLQAALTALLNALFECPPSA